MQGTSVHRKGRAQSGLQRGDRRASRARVSGADTRSSSPIFQPRAKKVRVSRNCCMFIYAFTCLFSRLDRRLRGVKVELNQPLVRTLYSTWWAGLRCRDRGIMLCSHLVL